MTTTPKIKGIPLDLGGTTYVLPPASLATLEAMSEPLDRVNAAFAQGSELGVKGLVFVADFAHACLLRNYPDITREHVAQHIDLGSVVDVLQMCLDTSGLMRKQLEAQASDAAQAPATTEGEGATLGESSGTALLPTS